MQRVIRNICYDDDVYFFLVFILFRYYPTPSVGDFGTKNDPIYRLHRHFSRTYFPHLVERNSFK